jgi:hypothetical protein
VPLAACPHRQPGRSRRHSCAIILQAIERVADRERKIDPDAGHRILTRIQIIALQPTHLVGSLGVDGEVETVDFFVNGHDPCCSATAADAVVRAGRQAPIGVKIVLRRGIVCDSKVS